MAHCRITLLVVLLALTYKIIHGSFIGFAEQDIPQQCIDHSVTPVSCKNLVTADNLLPHPDDCELFYYCVSPDHDPICRQCPAKLHFNPVKHVCDNPEKAGCTASTSLRK